MYPTALFAILDVAPVRAVLGTPVRIYPFGDTGTTPPSPPYVVHQLVSSVPDNCLDDPPPVDDERIQFSVWANDEPTLSAATRALRTQLQEYGYINSVSDNGRDPDTKRYGMVIDWSRLEPWA